MNPTTALVACANLSRSADPARKTCHVCLERRSYADSGANDVVTIAATDGTIVFRFDFELAGFPAEHWLHGVHGGMTAPGRAFPKFGAARWKANLVTNARANEQGLLELVAHSASGVPRKKQPPPVALVPGVGPLLAAWNRLTDPPDCVEIELDASFSECVAALDGDEIVVVSSVGGWLVLATGLWRAQLTIAADAFEPRSLRVSFLWDALRVHDATRLTLSRTDTSAPVKLTSDGHTAVVMPCKNADD